MRIVYFANGDIGLELLQWLIQQDENIVGLVVHPPHKARFAAEMQDICVTRGVKVFDGSRLTVPEVQHQIYSLHADIGISVFFGYILKSSIINLFPLGIINLHPSLLPFNRGAYPNVWSIIEGTPAGVTIHYIDEGIDTGPILAQQEIVVEPIDTGASLYEKLDKAGIDLFEKTWLNIKYGNISAVPQSKDEGTIHRVKDVQNIDEIDLDQTYVGRELINLLRARTFAPHRGAYFVVNGRRINVRIELNYDDL